MRNQDQSKKQTVIQETDKESLVIRSGLFGLPRNQEQKMKVLEEDHIGFQSKKQAFLRGSLEKIFVEFVRTN